MSVASLDPDDLGDELSDYIEAPNDTKLDLAVRVFLDQWEAREEAERIWRSRRRTGKELVERLLTVDDLLELPEPQWLVNGILHEQSLGVLYGQPGTFKSFVALGLAFSVATGTAWQKRSVRSGH